ncbi:MAG TPA: DUF2309 domain-containing protein [bacterium]|nr:DUF2309 domain-containing protein [bacterium]
MAHATEAPSTIAEIVGAAAHLLPEQAPLHTFVHHNTLHAFEHLSFDEAVQRAAELFGTEPYQTESAFAEHLRSGRILAADVEAVVTGDAQSREPSSPPAKGLTRAHYRRLRLMNLFEVPRGAALHWQLDETSLLRRVHRIADASRRRELQVHADLRHADAPPGQREAAMLRLLWRRLADATPNAAPAAPHPMRRRDQLIRAGGDDPDQRVHPLLIRLTAAFLDQGIATWPMPDRERGLLDAFRRIYGRPLNAPDAWMRGMAKELRLQAAEGLDAEATILRALDRLGVPAAEHADYITATLLSLKGWAGMMRQFELRPDRAPVEPRPARLIDFAAVQLTMYAFAAEHGLRTLLGAGADWADLELAQPEERPRKDLELTYEAFVMAQVAPIDLEAFDDAPAAARWLDEVRAFGELDRRRLLHRAYERRLRHTVLDGIAAHSRMPSGAPPKPTLQAVFCIDERECSTRRHLEEAMPTAETFGYAGFFGVAMAWQGLGEVQSRPLCPVNVTPQHYVTERALRPDEEQAWRNARRLRGLGVQALLRSSRAMTRGGLFSALLGWWSVVPMIGRCLFPRAAEHFLHKFVDPAKREPVTRLMLERKGDERDSAGRYIGYSVEEMTDVVGNLLTTIALTKDFCELVLVVGHGSSSLNNPHEAAHDCGATGGGRGGPNARALAAMANHPGVRQRLRERGIDIPDTTWFVGCYHNTCDDAMTWYDEDLIPPAAMPALAHAQKAMASACALDAHERCRRFESAPKNGDVAAALRHVEGRAVDLAQPRPEYGHATNAYAIVGRRARTRGLFLDRRAFLVSYDPTTDPDGDKLLALLGAVVPVGAGINLEYYFSFVDPTGYGCGTKLPHNISGLVGVMDGHSSDLRTGLPWQMVEIHEPVRLLSVIEAEPALLEKLLQRAPEMAKFIDNGWIQLVAWSPTDDRLWHYTNGAFEPYEPESRLLPVVATSAAFHHSAPGHLGCGRITASLGPAPLATTHSATTHHTDRGQR